MLKKTPVQKKDHTIFKTKQYFICIMKILRWHLIIVFSRTMRLISIKLGTKHTCVKGILSKGSRPTPGGGNSQIIVKQHWRLKAFSSRGPLARFQPILAQQILRLMEWSMFKADNDYLLLLSNAWVFIGLQSLVNRNCFSGERCGPGISAYKKLIYFFESTTKYITIGDGRKNKENDW